MSENWILCDGFSTVFCMGILRIQVGCKFCGMGIGIIKLTV